MLKTHQSANTNSNCLICLENNPTSFISHDENEKILHVVACSMNCLKLFLNKTREERTDISCPLCRKKITYLNDDKIFSLEEIEETRKQIACHLLKEETSKAKKLITLLQSQFNSDYFILEKTVPNLFNSIRSGLKTSEEGFVFLKQHMNASKKDFCDWCALYTYSKIIRELNAEKINEICIIAEDVLTKRLKTLAKENPETALPFPFNLYEPITISFKTYINMCKETNTPISLALHLCYFTEILPNSAMLIFSNPAFMTASFMNIPYLKNLNLYKL